MILISASTLILLLLRVIGDYLLGQLAKQGLGIYALYSVLKQLFLTKFYVSYQFTLAA